MKKTFIILYWTPSDPQNQTSNPNFKPEPQTQTSNPNLDGTSTEPRQIYDVCGHSLVLKLFENMGEMKFLFQ